MIARYEALSGAGYQIAVGNDGFDVLRERMGVRFECFASPLNCRYSRYCSAFIDTDAAFGSLGDFFSFYPQRGSFEANPPFVPEVMSRMVEHVHNLLYEALGPLSFVIIVPVWKKIAAWQELVDSTLCRGYLVLEAKDHGYVDGVQHQRWERYRPSSFDTAIICLQNPSGAEKWPFDTSVLKNELRAAMRHGAAVTPAHYEARIRTPSAGAAQQEVLASLHRARPREERNPVSAKKLMTEHLCHDCQKSLPATAFSRKMLTRPPDRRRCIECILCLLNLQTKKTKHQNENVSHHGELGGTIDADAKHEWR